MDQQGMLGRPRGPASQAGLQELPEELLLSILRRVEAAYVESGRTSAEFLQLRAVCKRLKQSVDTAVTNLILGVARGFCSPVAVLEVKDCFHRQLARLGGLRRVELHIRGDSSCALAQLLPALGQGCPGLAELRIANTGFEPDEEWGPYDIPDHLEALAYLSSLASLESLSLSGFHTFSGSLPSLPSLRVLDTDFGKLVCAAPLPALEELAHGDRREILYDSSAQKKFALRVPRRIALPRLRRLSLCRVHTPRLRLPKSLQVLELVHVVLEEQLDLREGFSNLAELRVAYHYPKHSPLQPQGLFALLSQGRLRQLTLQGRTDIPDGRVLVPSTPRLQTHMTALSLCSVQVPRLQEALAALTALTELELQDLDELEALDFSRLTLQHLRLKDLQKLCVLHGLELQTGSRSLVLDTLGLITHLPDFHDFTRLAVLKLSCFQLKKLNPDSCLRSPCLKELHVSNVWQPAPQAAARPPRQARRQPPPGPLRFDLKALKGLSKLTELELWGFAGSTVDLSSLPLLQSLHLSNCFKLSQLLGLHLLPHLRSVELVPGMPMLRTLTVASCPRLTRFSCRSENLVDLTLEGLPQLSSLDCLPDSLHTLHVAACPSLEKLEVGTLVFGQMSERTRRLRNMFPPPHVLPQLQTLKLVALAKLSGLSIKDAEFLESVHVSDCPLTELVLENLPKLTAPNFRINDLYLHAADSTLLPSAASSPPPTPYPPPLSSPHSLQVLRRLALIRLPGHLTLDQVALQTGLTHLTLDGLCLSRMPREMSSLTGLSELVLKNFEVECAEPLPPNAVSRLEKLTVARGGTNLLQWTGLGPACVGVPPRVQVVGGAVAPEIGGLRSITKLDLSELKVGSLDLSRMPSIQELRVQDCKNMTRLAGITNLLHLTSVELWGIPKLQELAIVSCPSLKSLECGGASLLHLHLEDLPSLEFRAGCFHNCFPYSEMTSVKSLKLHGVPCVSVVLHGLKALETIEVTQCSFLNEVHLENLMSLISLRLNEPNEPGGVALGEGSPSASRPPHLFQGMGRLCLVRLPKLETVFCPLTLQGVVVRSCPALTSNTLKVLNHKMLVKQCPSG